MEIDVKQTKGELMILPTFNIDYGLFNQIWFTFGWLFWFIRIRVNK